MAEVPWIINPFRGDKFEAAWLPVAEAALDFGATGWALFRSKEGGLDFTQLAFMPTKLDFERYWYSEEVGKAREEHRRLVPHPPGAGVPRHRRHGLAGAGRRPQPARSPVSVARQR